MNNLVDFFNELGAANLSSDCVTIDSASIAKFLASLKGSLRELNKNVNKDISVMSDIGMYSELIKFASLAKKINGAVEDINSLCKEYGYYKSGKVLDYSDLDKNDEDYDDCDDCDDCDGCDGCGDLSTLIQDNILGDELDDEVDISSLEALFSFDRETEVVNKEVEVSCKDVSDDILPYSNIITSNNSLKIGTKVTHTKFGLGKIKDIVLNEKKDNLVLIVAFNDEDRPFRLTQDVLKKYFKDIPETDTDILYSNYINALANKNSENKMVEEESLSDLVSRNVRELDYPTVKDTDISYFQIGDSILKKYDKVHLSKWRTIYEKAVDYATKKLGVDGLYEKSKKLITNRDGSGVIGVVFAKDRTEIDAETGVVNINGIWVRAGLDKGAILKRLHHLSNVLGEEILLGIV